MFEVTLLSTCCSQLPSYSRAANRGAGVEVAATRQNLYCTPQDRRGHVQLRVSGLTARALVAAWRLQALVRHQALGAHGAPRAHRARVALSSGYRVLCLVRFISHSFFEIIKQVLLSNLGILQMWVFFLENCSPSIRLRTDKLEGVGCFGRLGPLPYFPLIRKSTLALHYFLIEFGTNIIWDNGLGWAPRIFIVNWIVYSFLENCCHFKIFMDLSLQEQ